MGKNRWRARVTDNRCNSLTRLIRAERGVKIASPEESGRNLWLTRTCLSVPVEITKEGAQSLRMKMPNAELYLKEATVIYGFYLLAQDISN